MKKVIGVLFLASIALCATAITDQTRRNLLSGSGAGSNANILVLKPGNVTGGMKTEWSCSKTGADGTIYLGGTCNNRFALATISSQDVLTGLVVVFPSFAPGSKEKCTAMTIDGDGKVVLAGTSSLKAGTAYFAVARATSDGKIDKNFGTNGMKRIENKSATGLAGGVNDQCKDVTVDGYNNIILSGTSADSSGNSYFGVVRVPGSF